MSWPEVDPWRKLQKIPLRILKYMDLVSNHYATAYAKEEKLREGVKAQTQARIYHQKMKALDKLKDNSKKDYKLCWLTVNPHTDVKFSQFRDAIIKFVHRKMVVQYLYVFECRRMDDLDPGFHCHMLVQYSCKRYDFRRNAKSSFKKFVGNVDNQHHLCFRFISPDIVQEKLRYILDNPNKKEKDTWFRDLHDLEDYYGEAHFLVASD